MSLDPKSAREIVGFTRENTEKNPDAWLESAEQFHRAALLLCDEKQGGVIFPYYFVAGMSLELLLKALLVKRGSVPKTTHNLKKLCVDCGITISEEHERALTLLTEMIIWSGRYPVPNTSKEWDEYHDAKLEEHILRSRQGNVFVTKLNPKTFPGVAVYLSIWKQIREIY